MAILDEINFQIEESNIEFSLVESDQIQFDIVEEELFISIIEETLEFPQVIEDIIFEFSEQTEIVFNCESIGPEGKPGMKWKGEWDSLYQYIEGDVVYYRGTPYVSVINSNTNNFPSISQDWEVLVDNEGMSWKGIWDSGVSYDISDVSYFDGSSYVSLVYENLNATPSSSPQNWSIISSSSQNTVPKVTTILAGETKEIERFSKTDVSRKWIVDVNSSFDNAEKSFELFIRYFSYNDSVKHTCYGIIGKYISYEIISTIVDDDIIISVINNYTNDLSFTSTKIK